MAADESVEKLQNGSRQAWSISTHAFSDLSHVSPLMFLYLLKESYAHGELRASARFKILQGQVLQGLHHGPRPGPAVFVAQFLYISQIFDIYRDGFSHLMISAFRRFLEMGITLEDKREAKLLAAKLFLYIIQHSLVYDEKVLVKILEAFDVRLTDLEKVMRQMDEKTDISLDTATKFIEWFVSKLIDSQSYMTAVVLLQHFSICHQSGESLLLQMLGNKEYKAAEKWATYLGKPMLRVLVEEYVKGNLLSAAYNIIKANNMLNEYPDVCQQMKESNLKKLAEKGCWDVAERKTKGKIQSLQYLVYLAMEAGYVEKVEELCTQYSLEGFDNVNKAEANSKKIRYLHLDDIRLEDHDVVWVDEVNGLCDATGHLEECKIVGLDCEWKPNFEKGSKPNKVSIIQIASETKVYIFDLIKLYETIPASLDECLSRILHSSRILKLGYNFQCDVKQLARSYPDMECFEKYEMLLDIQNVFKETKGGLSGLAEKVLGLNLNKTRRNSNWEKRPLSDYQLEYAALDAAVLVEIFRHIPDHIRIGGGVGDEHSKSEWKSYIVSHIDKAKIHKKGAQSSRKNCVAVADESSTS